MDRLARLELITLANGFLTWPITFVTAFPPTTFGIMAQYMSLEGLVVRLDPVCQALTRPGACVSHFRNTWALFLYKEAHSSLPPAPIPVLTV